jgi:hypothetical protein
MTPIAVTVIAAVMLVRLVWDLSRPAPLIPEEPQPARRRYGAVFAPLACCFPAKFGGLTGPCARRRNHRPPCMTEDEIEHIAEGDHATTSDLARPDDASWGETHA